MFGTGSWAADGGPDPESIGLHRLSEETVIMGDTCNGERKAKRLVAQAAEAAARIKLGDAYDTMSEAEREKVCTSFIGDCHDHLRNIIINAMSISATDMLKDTLADDLDEFSSFDRMSVDGMDLIRAIYKEMHPGQEYAKGKGREALAWVKKMFPSAMWVPFTNAKGSRQDIAFDASLPIYANKAIAAEFLNGLVNVPKANNLLEKFLWRVLRCNEMTALMRTNTLWKLIVTEPMRWLTSESTRLTNWSLASADRVLELAEDAFIAVAADGSKLFDPTLDPFAEIAAQQPLFAAWRTQRMERTVKAADGTKHRFNERVLAEARSPSRAGNRQSTTTTVALAEKMATAALTAMHDTKRAIADKLSSQGGANAEPAKRQKVHAATVGAHVTNARCESNFGSYDYVGHVFRGTSVESLSGLTLQMRNHDFEHPKNVAHDRRKRKANGEPAPPATAGFYHRLPSHRLQHSLVEYARCEAPRARKVGQGELKEHDDAKLARREERVITLLNKAVEHYAYAKELFCAWEGEQAARSKADVERALKDRPEAQQLEYLRKQIEMRVLGLGWTQFDTRWSSNKDSRIGTVAHLKALLIDDIIPEEMAQRRRKELPTEAALPHMTQRDLGRLGTVDADVADIEKKAVFSAEELAVKAEAEMQRRIEAGIADTVENLNGHDAPAFDQQLVGKQLEVCWKYTNKDTGEPMLIWATGRVKRVADGLTDKRSRRARSILPAGMVLWAWDADPEFEEAAGEQWLGLLPSKWNPPRQQLYGWRFDPREFAAPGVAREAPQRDERRRNATCVVE